MSNVYFTADHHFCHANILSYADRPFVSTEQMDAEMFLRWNETVSPADTVYHLGDFALASADRIAELLAGLNGYKILIAGNHDRSAKQMVDLGFDEAYAGKSVHVWGCGGLGSWIAEFIARAGASHITLCDPGDITGGLLVRQNYVEADIGHSKADALAVRLRAIRDDLTVTVARGALPEDSSNFMVADRIIDATVSNSITQYLDSFAAQFGRKALIAQVATDARSGTLGILHLCSPELQLGLSKIDHKAGLTIISDGELELYHGLWQESLDEHELIPTRGCSVPTFHGSAADLAAVAATLVSLLGDHLRPTATALSGTHLIALPHADSGPRHHFHPARK